MTERIRFLPAEYEAPTRSPRGPIGSRLQHEHDANDAFSARIDWYQKFKTLEKSLEKKDDFKHVKMVFNILVWIHVLLVPYIGLLKYWGVI